MKVEELRKPFVVAHRGASALEPENTISAVRKAIELGFDMIEVDIRLSKDGEVVLMHDSRVDRITDGRGEIKSLGLEEIRRLRVRGRERIAFLKDIMEITRDKAALLLDIKDPDAALEALKLVKERGMLGQVVFNSSDIGTLEKIREAEPQARLSYSPSIQDNLVEIARKLSLFMASVRFDLITRKLVETMHKLGVRITSWGTNDPSIIQKLIYMGVDGIIIDDPQLIKTIHPVVGPSIT